MKKLIGFGGLMAFFATPTLASLPVSVPEVGTTGSVVALAAIVAGGALAWERRRARKNKD